jgi:hypothetical protein
MLHTDRKRAFHVASPMHISPHHVDELRVRGLLQQVGRDMFAMIDGQLRRLVITTNRCRR